MRKLKSNIVRYGEGFVTLVPEEDEDLWQLYNLIAPGDALRAVTLRKVTKETSGTGTVVSERKRIQLTVVVTQVDYDARGGIIRVSGKNVTMSPHIQVGQHHTLQIRVNETVTISKRKWDSEYNRKLKEALSAQAHGEVAVLLLDAGIANFYLLTPSLVKEILKIHVNIPKARTLSDAHCKAREKFFQQVFQGLQQQINIDSLHAVLIAGPGFVKDEFLEWMHKEAVAKGRTSFISHSKKFITARASTAFKSGLTELLADPTVKARLTSTKALKQIDVLEEFYKTLRVNPDAACYGPLHVAEAVRMGAVKNLLVTDGLFRSSNVRTRMKFVKMTEDVIGAGGDVIHFPDQYVAGEQLSGLSGIAAILRYSIPELNDIEEVEDDPTPSAALEANEEFKFGMAPDSLFGMDAASDVIEDPS